MAEEKKTPIPEKQAEPVKSDGQKAPSPPAAEKQPEAKSTDKPGPAVEKAVKKQPAKPEPVKAPAAGKAKSPGPVEQKQKSVKADAPKGKAEPAAPVKSEPIKAADGKVVKLPIPPKQEQDTKKPTVKAPAKSDKPGKSGDKSKPAPRDKMSQSKSAAVKPPAKLAVEPPAPEQPAEPPRPMTDGKVVYLKISELHPFHTFRAHPYKVENNARMQELKEAIRTQGVITPATVRPEKDGKGYEIISGHCRRHASEAIGLTELPCIVREMTDHEAVMEMKNSNKQRGDPLPSELARLLDLEMEDIKHQGGRLKGVAAGDIGKRSAEIVGENNGMNYKKVMRYVRLNSLTPELLDMVDAKKIGFMPAVELSYIKPKNQRLISVSIEGEQSSPSVAQAKKLRELDKDGKLTGDIIDGILSEEKKEVDRVIISTDELNKYFGKEVTPRQMKDQIIALLDEWKEKQPRAKIAPEKTPERG